MDEITITELDINDTDKLIEYEEEIYKAFAVKEKGGWVDNNYELINNNRLRAKIPYEDQVIYYAEKNGEIVSAGSLNFNYNKKFQLEDMGFKIKKDQPMCEGLAFFSNKLEGEDSINIFSKLTLLYEKIMIDKGINVVYLTCDRKVKALYSLNGFIKVDSIIINEKKKLLMKLDLRTERSTDLD